MSFEELCADMPAGFSKNLYRRNLRENIASFVREALSPLSDGTATERASTEKTAPVDASFLGAYRAPDRRSVSGMSLSKTFTVLPART